MIRLTKIMQVCAVLAMAAALYLAYLHYRNCDNYIYAAGNFIIFFTNALMFFYQDMLRTCDLTTVLSSSLNHNLSGGWLPALLDSRQAA